MRGSGYLLRIPVIDISEVGAGGGSIAYLDPAGALRVGPQSAGAVPGPVCYGQGNSAPTVTDANLVLGFLHDGALAGGALQVDRALAASAIQTTIAAPFDLPLHEAAYGIHDIANSNMVRAIKSVSVERGRDPADFTLMAFGGAGPIHAAGVARALGIHNIIIPPAPGLFSALGLLRAEVEHHTTRTVLTSTQDADLDALQTVLDEMVADLYARIREEGFDDDAITYRVLLDMRYTGQSSELMVPFPSLRVTADTLRHAEEAFEAEFERMYSHRAERKVFELVNCHLVATVARGIEPQAQWTYASDGGPTAMSQRQVYFGPEFEALNTTILTRAMLDDQPRSGPIVIEEYDSTVVVPPDCQVSCDPQGNLIIDLSVAQT